MAEPMAITFARRLHVICTQITTSENTKEGVEKADFVLIDTRHVVAWE